DAAAMAEVLAREFIAMGPSQIRFVNWNMLPVERWYEANWPLFAGIEELKQARDTVREQIRRRKRAANPLVAELDDEHGQPTWMDPELPLPRERIARRFARYPGGFLVHPDH